MYRPNGGATDQRTGGVLATSVTKPLGVKTRVILHSFHEQFRSRAGFASTPSSASVRTIFALWPTSEWHHECVCGGALKVSAAWRRSAIHWLKLGSNSPVCIRSSADG